MVMFIGILDNRQSLEGPRQNNLYFNLKLTYAEPPPRPDQETEQGKPTRHRKRHYSYAEMHHATQLPDRCST